jgi:inner membrane protein
MDNLTHSLVGLTAAKAGLEKLSPGATVLCVLAANSPDVDIVVLLFQGRWGYLHHHRGITHSLVGSAVLALALPLAFYLGDRIIAQIRKRERQVRLKGLLIVSILTTATHPLLDWSNNYGIRLLLPWYTRWSYGDFTFVVDPFIWMILGVVAFLMTTKTKAQLIYWLVIALVPSFLILSRLAGSGGSLNGVLLPLLWIVVLIVSVTLYRLGFGERAGSRTAIAAFLAVVIYGTGLFVAHAVALRQAKVQAAAIANNHSEHIIKLAAMATAANPNSWVCVMKTDRATYRFDLSLLGENSASSPFVRYENPEGVQAETAEEAERDYRAQVFLGFARFPVMRVVGEDCVSQTLVQFADLRYTEPGNGRGTFSLDVPVDCPLPDKRDK